MKEEEFQSKWEEVTDLVIEQFGIDFLIALEHKGFVNIAWDVAYEKLIVGDEDE